MDLLLAGLERKRKRETRRDVFGEKEASMTLNTARKTASKPVKSSARYEHLQTRGAGFPKGGTENSRRRKGREGNARERGASRKKS